jgi:hypothetical protein
MAAALAVLSFGLLPARGDEPEPVLPIEPAEAAAEELVPEEFKDRAYERYLDVAYLRDSLAAADAAGLTDCALQLAEGERVLLRPHKAVSSDTVFRLAAKVAADKRDKETLNRLGRAAKELKKDELAAVVAAAVRLAGGSRKPDPAVSVALDQVSAEAVVLYKSFAAEIKSAKAIGSKSQLDVLEQSLKSAELDERLKGPLLKQLAEARSALPEKGDPELDVLGRLAMASRAVRPSAATVNVTLINKAGVGVTFHVSGGTANQSLAAGASSTFHFAAPRPGQQVLLTLVNPSPHPTGGYALKEGMRYQFSKDKSGMYGLYLAK